MSDKKVYNIDEIMKMLPHCYPFLLVDRLEVEEPGVKGVGIKNLTMNEEFFQGQAADLVPLAQLGRSRPVVLDMPDLALNPVGIQPLLCLLTGTALRIAKKNHVVTLL